MSNPLTTRQLVLVLQGVAVEYSHENQWEHDTLRSLELRAKRDVCSDLATRLVELERRAAENSHG